MTATTIEIGTLITRSRQIRQGRSTIAGTGVTVRRIVSWYKLGLTPEEILNRIGHPHLDLAKEEHEVKQQGKRISKAIDS